MADLASAFARAVPPMQATPERINQALLREQQRRKTEARFAELPFEPAPTTFTLPPRELRSYSLAPGETEDWRDVAARGAGEVTSGVIGKDPRQAAADTSTLMMAGDFAPVVGDVMGALDAISDLRRGNWGSAAINTAAAAVPFLSGAGLKKGLEAATNGEEAAADISRALGNEPRPGAAADVLAAATTPEPFAFERQGVTIRPPEATAPEDYTPEVSAADDLAAATIPPDPRAGAWWRPDRPEPEPGRLDPLPGSPVGPIEGMVDTAEEYARQRGLNLARQPEYAKADPIRSGWISDEYQAMQHNPNDPATRAAYEAMANETLAQWEVLKKSGLKVQFVKPGQPHPYPGGPKEALADLRDNNHLWVDPTSEGFGNASDFDPTGNPLLRPTGEVIDGHPVVVNDIFRIVHDALGHGTEGGNFGPRGEENAWLSHSRLYSPEAVGAVTSETRGQNSWVNYGPHGEANRANPRETVFADQKTGLMPPWTAEEKGMKPGYEPQVDAMWGELNNPGALFEGVRPSEFTPDQMYRFGKKYGVDDLGPPDTQAWIASLEPYTLPDGREVYIPGGLDSKEPFTYYDKLFMKQQGINPNDLDIETHGQIHDRFISSYMKNPPSDEAVFNQLLFATISPNQPLSENELALARAMIKGPEDLKKFANAIPWNYKDAQNITKEQRKAASQKIAAMLGINKSVGGVGGMGISGSADYSRMAEFAQKYQEDPKFFRFQGAGEGGATPAENWANYADRIANQVSGLGSKTASLGTVWQSPGTAQISAVDRHMLDEFGEAMFDKTGKDTFEAFKAATVKKYNKSKIKGGPKKGQRVKQVTSWDELPKFAQHEAMFTKVNAHPQMQYTEKKTGGINPKVPEHLQNLPFPLTKGGGQKVQVTSPAYRKVNEATAESRGSNLAPEDRRSVFAQQWLLWDRIRQRLEPHEITHAGLEKLPRMSLDEIRRVKADMEKAGYMKKGRQPDPGTGIRKMQPVQPTPSNRQGFASRGAYWSAIPGAGIGLGATSRALNKDRDRTDRKSGT